MTDLMRLNLRATEIRARLSELAGVTDLTDEHRSELDTLRNEYRDNEVKSGALMIAGDTPVETITEDRQLSESCAARWISRGTWLAAMSRARRDHWRGSGISTRCAA